MENISVDALQRIAKAFGINLRELFLKSLGSYASSNSGNPIQRQKQGEQQQFHDQILATFFGWWKILS